jgi:hypothetical protein
MPKIQSIMVPDAVRSEDCGVHRAGRRGELEYLQFWKILSQDRAKGVKCAQREIVIGDGQSNQMSKMMADGGWLLPEYQCGCRTAI